jgi:hypothetical protein
MTATEETSSGSTVYAREPVPVATVRRELALLEQTPELACIDAWSSACKAWWSDEHDRRLRTRALETLLLGDAELEAWLARPLDQQALIDAHRHVTSMRAGVERGSVRRRLAASQWRTGPVWVESRAGVRTVVPGPEEVPAQVAAFERAAAELPAQPLVRAGWLAQAIGVIHPFHDANGGTSRFLGSIELARACLPPFVLTVAQRNRTYIEALQEANRTLGIATITRVVHDAVQMSLAAALLSGTGMHAAWQPALEERTDRWLAIADARCRARLGETVEPIDAPGIARLSRRGYRIPAAPALRGGAWRVAGGAQLDVAIVPVQGGPTTWLAAMVDGSIGERGRLAAIQTSEAVTTMFVCPEGEPDAIAEPRFASWLETRLDQCVRGLALWM